MKKTNLDSLKIQELISIEGGNTRVNKNAAYYIGYAYYYQLAIITGGLSIAAYKY